MNIDLPASKPDGGQKDPARVFETLYKSLRADIERIPSDNQIPPAPLSADDEAEVKSFVQNTLGLPVADVPSERIFLGGEILSRSNFREGRIGIWEGLPIFVLLYRMEKSLRTVVVWPRDGINVRLLAKAVVWGYATDFPPMIGETDIASTDRFFQCRKLDFSRLSAAPVSDAEKLELLREHDDSILSLRREKDRISDDAARQGARMQARINELLADAERFRASSVGDANRADLWRFFAVCSVVSVPVFVWLIRWLGY